MQKVKIEIDGVNPLSQRPFIAIDDYTLMLMENAKTHSDSDMIEARINYALKLIEKPDDKKVETGYKVLEMYDIYECHIPHIDKEFIDFIMFMAIYKKNIVIRTRNNIDFIGIRVG